VTRAPLLRPEFGPSLPELVSRRFSVSRRLVAVVAVIALAVLVVAIRAVTDNGLTQATVHGNPSFNVLYDPAVLHRAAPGPGELIRLVGRRARVSTEVTVRPANLPPYAGDVVGGQLPLYVSQLARRLEQQLPGFAMGAEGKARINKAPGYQFAYTSGSAGDQTQWNQTFVMPAADQPGQTVVLRMRQTISGRRPGARGRALLKATKKAFRSFRFGTRRPLFG
jgi:hypothetical protein